MKLKIFGEHLIESSSIEQIKNSMLDGSMCVLTADSHKGYGVPIGGVVAYKDKVSLSAVGYDIACGNAAVRTNVLAKDVNMTKLMDEVYRQISFGVGRTNNEKVSHEVFDQIGKLELRISKNAKRDLLNKAINQLGTIGSGNHFVDIFEDESGFLWVGVHFGSRGFGHTLTTGFIALAKGKEFGDKVSEGGADAMPILFDANSEVGMDYINAVNVAGEYAYAGRNWVCDKVLSILGAKETYKVHNHHNFLWQEEHFGEKWWVGRKGATPAFPNQQSFIGANMFDHSVIVEGVKNEEAEEALYSTVHGAGRVMSRTEARGKSKWIRDEATGKKRPHIISKGKVDFDNTKRLAKEYGVELRGAGPDESPECYKKLSDVLDAMGDTIKVIHKLKPIGVAMAGENEHDPYKD